MARPRKYTAKKLREGVEAYFAGISRMITLREQVNTGEKDGWGHWVYVLKDICNDAGEPVKVRQFVTPPTVGGLCKYLGIHRSTWADYSAGELYPELKPVTDWAREVMQDYLETELLSREGKNLKGVIFSLQNNYGYHEKREVELGEKAAKAVTAASIPTSERAALLRELALEFAQEGADDETGED